MLIVLEGCDGSGKSSLAELLANLCYDPGAVEVIHATRETPNDMEWFSKIMDDARNKNIIMDRAFWGQFVYQNESKRSLTYQDLKNLENRLQTEGGKLIYVYSPERVIKRRLAKRSELTDIPIRTILRKYKNLCIHSHCPVIWYNSHNGTCKIFEHYKGGITK